MLPDKFTVGCIRYGPDRQEEEHAFNTKEEAKDFAYIMLCSYGFRVWINNVEFTKKGYNGK